MNEKAKASQAKGFFKLSLKLRDLLSKRREKKKYKIIQVFDVLVTSQARLDIKDPNKKSIVSIKELEELKPFQNDPNHPDFF